MKRTVIAFLAFTAIHFSVSYGGGFLLFLTVGFSRRDVVAVFEAVLVAGVTFFGLPDTVLGWLLNSFLYGFLFALVFYLWQSKLKRVAHEPA